MAKKKIKRSFPTKECPQCKTLVHAAKSQCSNCPYTFPKKRRKKKRKKKIAVGATAAASPKRRGRAPKRRTRPVTSGNFSVEDFQVALGLVQKLGAANVKKLAEALG